LDEVRGIGPATLGKLRPYLRVNAAYIRRLNLLTADSARLASHPYLNSQQVTYVLAKRKAGTLQTDSLSLVGSYQFLPSDYWKLRPYLEAAR
jgi:hypothetical protein